MNKELHVPHFGIQPDWEDVKDGKCWISFREFGQDKSVHGELNRSGQGQVNVTSSEPFHVLKEKSGGRHVTIESMEAQSKEKVECSFVASSSAFNTIHKTGVISLDVSEGGLGVSICKNNDMKIWETDTGNIRRILQGHPIDAYVSRFFPSGIVVLSGGADCCLKISSAETGDCPVTLRGHSAAVQDTAIVERGRNVVSVSKDGSVRLWDCGEGKCLDVLYSCNTCINSCVIMSPTEYDLGNPIPKMSDREILTKGKLLVIGREDGKVTGISISGRKELFTCSLPSAVNKVIQVGPNAFAVGCQGGEIGVFQLNELTHPLMILSATKSPVLDLLVHPSTQKLLRLSPFWASKSDGTVMLINPINNKQNCSKIIQLTGPDCDPVYQIKNDLDFIYTASRDGLIRKYSLKVINLLII